MTDSGQGGERPPAGRVPATPGEQPLAPPGNAAPTPPAPPPGPPPGAMPPSTFPGQDSATMRVMPTYHPNQPPVASVQAAAAPTAERHIGKYIVKRELGRGGMGAVYLAEQPGLGREVAIKQLLQAADPVALRRFLQEAQVMARISHPNLVQVHDMELQGTTNYLVLEYVRGRSLRDWLNQGSLPPAQVFAVMHGVLQAL